jgi:hypothetical protein
VKQTDILALAQDRLIPVYETEKRHLDWIDQWYRWDPEKAPLPRQADKEAKYLLDLARTPWLGLVVTTVAQMLYLERIYSGQRSAEDVSLDDHWGPWQRNDMESRQIPVHRAALAYGLSYTVTLPGVPGAVIQGVSPRQGLAVYADVADDEFPMYFLWKKPQAKAIHWRVLDEEKVHFLAQDDPGSRLEYIEERPHDMGVCPAVRYANQLDLEGRAPGDIEPLIPTAGRINKTDYDRLLAQHYNSWKVRTATGLDESANTSETKMRLRQQDILTGGEGVQFGTLDETSLEGFIKAHESDLETLAGTSQTPVSAYGKLVNVSAEGLVEMRASLRAKVLERQKSFGGSHVRTLRLAAIAEGRDVDAADFTIEGRWADVEAVTMAQAVDALGKASQMLGVPGQLLWDRIPGVDLTTAQSWRKWTEEHPSPDEVQAQAVARQLGTSNTLF